MFEILPTSVQAFIQVLFIFAFCPLLIGVMRKVKARFQGRSGGPILQPYLDVLKLLSKGSAKSSLSSFIFIIAPVVGFVGIAIAALALPILTPVPFLAINLIAFVYLFSISRILSALSGFDAGSAFGNLGSSREVLYSVLIEPAILAVVLFVVVSGSGLGPISPIVTSISSWLSPSYLLAAAGLFIIILAETGRLPFDNPATHLELTMVHEAMILENSGPALALIEWANSAKIFILFSLLATLFVPFSVPSGVIFHSVFVLGICLILGIFTAILESLTVKVRLFKVGELLLLAMIFAILSFLSAGFNLQGQNLTTGLAFVMLLSSLYFIFSATFRRRIELYVLQSICLVLIFLIPAIYLGTFDAYFQLGTTIIFKLILIPILLFQLFRVMPGEVKLMPAQFFDIFNVSKAELKLNLDSDPLFMGAPVSPSRALMYSAILIVLAFGLSSIMGGTTILLPLVISLILIGMLIIAVKTNLLLQLIGFLLMENGVVLLPSALPIQLPFIGDLVALFDVVILIIVAVLLVFKIRGTVGTLNAEELDQLVEKR